MIGALVMTAAIFPAYGLARFVVSRPWAIAAAIGAVAAPPLAYAPYLLEEPLAYTYSTTALWAIAAAVARPTWRRHALAAALCLVAPFVRGELAVLLAVYGAALFVLLWRTDRFERWRATWTAWDWVGAVTLAVGAALAVSAAAGHRSDAWYVATGFNKQRVFDYGLWSRRGDDDRPGGAAGRGHRRRLRITTGSRHRRGPCLRGRRRRGLHLLRDLRRGQGDLPLDEVRRSDRRAQRDLPRSDRAGRDGRRAGPPDRVGICARSRLPRGAAPRGEGRAQARPVSVLRGAEPRDRPAREPQLLLGRRRRRACARARGGALAGAARGTLVRPFADRRAHDRSGRSVRGDDLGDDDRDLCLARPQPLRGTARPVDAETGRLGRPGDR